MHLGLSGVLKKLIIHLNDWTMGSNKYDNSDHYFDRLLHL